MELKFGVCVHYSTMEVTAVLNLYASAL